MMILITGAGGQLGQHLCISLKESHIDFVPKTHRELDVSNMAYLKHTLALIKPSIIINCAAYNAVDKAESDQLTCSAVNEHAVKQLANYCKNNDALLIHFSTDYVFDGIKKIAYTEDDKPNPINYYGQSKLAGERAIQQSGCRHYIIRTSWLYSELGENFYTIMQRLSKQNKPVKVVNDQTGTPTHVNELSKLVLLLITDKKIPFGLFHFAGTTILNRIEFAQKIFDENNSTSHLVGVTSDDYGNFAKRPKNSALDSSRLRQLFFERK